MPGEPGYYVYYLCERDKLIAAKTARCREPVLEATAGQFLERQRGWRYVTFALDVLACNRRVRTIPWTVVARLRSNPEGGACPEVVELYVNLSYRDIVAVSIASSKNILQVCVKLPRILRDRQIDALTPAISVYNPRH